MFDLTSEGWSAVLTMGKIFSSSGRSKTSTIIGQSRVCVSTFEIVSMAKTQRFSPCRSFPRPLPLSLTLSLFQAPLTNRCQQLQSAFFGYGNFLREFNFFSSLFGFGCGSCNRVSSVPSPAVVPERDTTLFEGSGTRSANTRSSQVWRKVNKRVPSTIRLRERPPGVPSAVGFYKTIRLPLAEVSSSCAVQPEWQTTFGSESIQSAECWGLVAHGTAEHVWSERLKSKGSTEYDTNDRKKKHKREQ